MTAKTGAQRQAEFRLAMAKAGKVRIGFFASKTQRDKLRQLGGAAWLLKKIDRAKLPG